MSSRMAVSASPPLSQPPPGGVGLVGVVFDCHSCASAEQSPDHLVAPELDGKVQRGRVAVRARVDFHPGVEEEVDDGAAVVQRREHERLAEGLARIVGWRSPGGAADISPIWPVRPGVGAQTVDITQEERM